GRSIRLHRELDVARFTPAVVAACRWPRRGKEETRRQGDSRARDQRYERGAEEEWFQRLLVCGRRFVWPRQVFQRQVDCRYHEGSKEEERHYKPDRADAGDVRSGRSRDDLSRHG